MSHKGNSDTIYIIQNTLIPDEIYKVGRHKGDISKLISRYITAIPQLKIRLLVKTNFANLIEAAFKSGYSSYRIPILHPCASPRSKIISEWVKMPFDQLEGILQSLISNYESNPPSIPDPSLFSSDSSLSSLPSIPDLYSPSSSPPPPSSNTVKFTKQGFPIFLPALSHNIPSVSHIPGIPLTLPPIPKLGKRFIVVPPHSGDERSIFAVQCKITNTIRHYVRLSVSKQEFFYYMFIKSFLPVPPSNSVPVDLPSVMSAYC